MKRGTLLSVISLMLIFGLCGCRDDEEPAAETEQVAPPEELQRLGAALHATTEYLDEHARFLKDSERELDELEEKLGTIRDEQFRAGGPGSVRVTARLIKTQEALGKARQRLSDLRQANADAWDEQLDQFRAAMKELQDAYGQLTQAAQASPAGRRASP